MALKKIENLTVASDRIIAAFFSRLPKTKPTPFSEILLVVLLGSIELLGRQNLGDNLSVQHLFLSLLGLQCGLLLLGRVEVYSGSVLRAHIIPLPKLTTFLGFVQMCMSNRDWRVVTGRRTERK